MMGEFIHFNTIPKMVARSRVIAIKLALHTIITELDSHWVLYACIRVKRRTKLCLLKADSA